MARRLIAFGCLTVVALITVYVGVVFWAFRGIDPPPIVAPIAAHADQDDRLATAQFTTVLLHDFPIGSSAKRLESELMAQDFKHEPALDISKCLPEGKSAPVGKSYMTCPVWDAHWNPHNLLLAGWHARNDIVCGHVATVAWSTDAQGKITHLDGTIDYRCL